MQRVGRKTGGSSPAIVGSVRNGLLLPPLVFLLSILITASAWIISSDSIRQAQKDYFDFRVRETMERIEQRMQAYEEVLRGGQGLFKASSDVGRTEFRDYVASLRLAEYYPGIQGVGFSLVVPAAEMDRHLRRMRAQGFPEYTIRPAGERDPYSSIVYLEPFADRNLRAFGFDMYSEAVRREAMDRARDSGEVTMTGKVRLVQESGQREQAGFLMYAPVFRNGKPIITEADRRASLVGWVYAPFRMDDLMEGIQSERVHDLDIEIFDGKETDLAALMYDSDGSRAVGLARSGAMEASHIIEIAGRPWTVKAFPLAGIYSRVSSDRATLIALAGGAISILLGWLTWLLVTARERAISAAKKMNHDLIEAEVAVRKQEQRLSEIIWGTNIGTWEWNVQTGEAVFNERWAEIVGYTLDDLAPCSIETWIRLVHPEDGKRSGELLERCFRREAATYECEARMRHKNGEWVWVLDRGKVVEWTADGKPLRMSGTHQDITEQKLIGERLKEERDFTDGVLDTARSLIMVIDREGRVVRLNREAEAFTGYALDEVKDEPFFWERFLLPEQREKVHGVFSSTMAGNVVPRYENYWVSRDGSKRLFDWSNSILRDAGGDAEYLITVGIDITDKKKAESEIRRYVELVDKYVISSTTDRDGVILSASDALCRLSGYSRDELIGSPYDILRHPDMPDSLYQELWATILDGRVWQGEIKGLTKNGDHYWTEVHIEPSFSDGGEVVGFTAIRQDITARKLAEALSITDKLTQLYNRRKLDDALQKEIERSKRFGLPLSVIMFDIDFFKRVNDAYGHQAGDEVLVQVARLLKENVRGIDVPGRWGGEEFLVVCPETDVDGACLLAEKLRAIVAAHEFHPVGHNTCSFGVASRLPDESVDALLGRLDAALYCAKEQGRNRVVVSKENRA
ncbi:MAG TPA: CHASE domain-containing protein [Sideroxyarcus sp.]|nr:CHASE domain-containing protein [Sideroxyarcus sp.]